MATLEDTKIEDFSHTDEIHALADTDSVIYQKATAVCSVWADDVSEEVKSLGGLEVIAGSDVSMADGIYTIQAPIVIMDDSSFATYCEQIGVSSAENGSIVLNRIWDNINSNFRYKEYVPFFVREPGHDDFAKHGRCGCDCGDSGFGLYTGSTGFERRI